MHLFLIKLYVLDWNWKKRCGNHNHLYLFKKVSWFRIPSFLICNDGQDTQSFVSKLVLFFAKNKIQCHNAVILKKKVQRGASLRKRQVNKFGVGQISLNHLNPSTGECQRKFRKGAHINLRPF